MKSFKIFFIITASIFLFSIANAQVIPELNKEILKYVKSVEGKK
jgi:hypothetical protein